MKRKYDVTIEEILDAIMLQESKPSHQALLEWCKKYPDFRQDIADFFAAWAVETENADHRMINEDRVASRMVSHAMNMLHRQPVQNDVKEEEQVRLFKLIEASGKSEETLMNECNLDDSLLSKLDRRLIEFISIPRRCIQTLAAMLKLTDEVVIRALSGKPIALAGYKSKIKPTSAQETFIDAVAASDLSDDKKNEWVKIANNEKSE